jgi:hypothetical protein
MKKNRPLRWLEGRFFLFERFQIMASQRFLVMAEQQVECLTHA